MSSRKQPKYRGPSRPVDPRYAPGAPGKKGIDSFGLVLIGVSTAAVLLIILYIAVTQGGGTAGTTAGTTGTGTGTQPQVPIISAQEALPQVTTGAARIVDVRLPTQYDAEHIQGATNLPYDKIQSLAAEVPRQGDVILYCQ
jgi:hypothetical protein